MSVADLGLATARIAFFIQNSLNKFKLEVSQGVVFLH